MGVMGCHRRNCENIMCRTYISEVGYVCAECKQEFSEYLESIGKSEMPEGEMLRELEKFMDTNKNTYTQGENIHVADFFSREDDDEC